MCVICGATLDGPATTAFGPYGGARPRVLSVASEQTIVDSLADRGFGAALLLFELDDASEVIDADDLRRGNLDVRCYFGCAVPDTCRDAIREAVGVDISFDADHADQCQY